MKSLFRKFARDERGATAIEYALIATGIGVAIIIGANALGDALGDRFSGLATSVTNAGGPTAPAPTAEPL